MDSKLSQIGNIISVVVNPKYNGIVSFNSFTDNLLGLTAYRTVSRKFRLTTDNLFYTDWEVLNNANLSKHQNINANFLSIEVQYTRTGTDDTGVIEFVDIAFSCTYEPIDFIAPTIDESIFKNIINSGDVLELENNLFKKLYYRGIIPEYVLRGENRDKEKDKDYIDFISVIAKFFSLILNHFKRFENSYDDFDILRELVRQYGLYFDESNITLDELKYLSSNMYDEFRKRGTKQMFIRKGETLANGEVNEIDGEFIRLLRNKNNDELLQENIVKNNIGWCLKQCSPMYSGTLFSTQINKTQENTKEFNDLSKFATFKSGGGVISIKTISTLKSLSLALTSAGTSGLGSLTVTTEDKLIPISSGLDYEITFMFKVVTSGDGKLKFEVNGYDNLMNKLSDAFVTQSGEFVMGKFFEVNLSKFNKTVWYLCRGIIHSYSTSHIDGITTNLGIGNNLYFNNRFTTYILPKIFVEGTTASEIAIYDYKVRPLVRGTNILPLKNGIANYHSLGFIEASRMIYFYVKSNNNSISEDETTEIIRKYLLSYSENSIINYLK